MFFLKLYQYFSWPIMDSFEKVLENLNFLSTYHALKKILTEVRTKTVVKTCFFTHLITMKPLYVHANL